MVITHRIFAKNIKIPGIMYRRFQLRLYSEKIITTGNINKLWPRITMFLQNTLKIWIWSGMGSCLIIASADMNERHPSEIQPTIKFHKTMPIATYGK